MARTVNDKQLFTLSEDQHTALLDACKPVPYLVVGGMPPRSPQQNANAAWRRLGSELGFDWESVEPAPGRDSRSFLATPETKAPRAEQPAGAQATRDRSPSE